MSIMYPLCSSSKGNCIFLGNEQEGVLVDVGISCRALGAQLALVGIPMKAVRAILITHEHSDHVRGLSRISKKLGVPVYASAGTASVLLEQQMVDADLLQVTEGKPFWVGSMQIRPFSTSHDAVDSQNYRVCFPDGEAAVCTDLGVVTETVHEALAGCKTVLLESNYEETMLQMGPYPYFLKRRIASVSGHLSNTDAAQELIHLAKSGTSRFVLGHLSPENNRPELAYQQAVLALSTEGLVLDRDYTLMVAPKTGIGQLVTL